MKDEEIYKLFGFTEEEMEADKANKKKKAEDMAKKADNLAKLQPWDIIESAVGNLIYKGNYKAINAEHFAEFDVRDINIYHAYRMGEENGKLF